MAGLSVSLLATGAARAQTPASKPAGPQAPAVVSATPHTLTEALMLAYTTNTTLLAERANVRATDENVPAALAGWRPTVTVTANAGYIDGLNHSHAGGNDLLGISPSNTTVGVSRGTNAQTVTLSQPLYTGGQTKASLSQSENKVMGERARLLTQEQTTFYNVVIAYVGSSSPSSGAASTSFGVIQDEQLLALNINNEQVLARQLQATNDRFRVGEITRTDVAQAEAALAQATATRQTAEGNLATARAYFQQIVGAYPGKLIEPQPLRLPVKTLDLAKSLAGNNNPNVVAALFDDAAAKDNFDLQYSRLMPNISLQGLVGRGEDVSVKNLTQTYQQLTVNLSVPIYQGGVEYAGIRNARQLQQRTRALLEDQRRAAIEAVVSAWGTYTSSKAAIDSTRENVRANEVALEGVQREAIVGSRTTLDVLNAEQALLSARVQLVQNLASFVTASYQVAQSVGRLTARDLNLQVPLYDETAYYKAVRNRWIGTGDYATDQPAR